MAILLELERNDIMEFEKLLNSKNENCLVVGMKQFKVADVLTGLSHYAPGSKVLVRVNNKDDIWRCLSYEYRDYRFECGKGYKFDGRIDVYFDTFNITSQRKTPREFDYIIVFPADALKPLFDRNIEDILHHRRSKKVFWVKGNSPEIGWLKFICDIDETLDLSIEGEIRDDVYECNIAFDKILVDHLGWSEIERAISSNYNTGYCSIDIDKLRLGEYRVVKACGESRNLNIAIKVEREVEGDKFLIYMKSKK